MGRVDVACSLGFECVIANEGNFVGTKRVRDEFQSESIANPVRGARA